MTHRRFTFARELTRLVGLELALPNAVEIDEDARTIEGVIVPFNVVAERTSYGKPVKFAAGSLRLPADVSRVKLLRDHDTGQPVGYATAIIQDDTAATATFFVPPGAAGDQALLEASYKLRDGLSVGVDIIEGHEDGDTYIVDAATIDEVSQCAIPAFTDARVTRVAAASTDTPAELDAAEELDTDEELDDDDTDEELDDDTDDPDDGDQDAGDDNNNNEENDTMTRRQEAAQRIPSANAFARRGTPNVVPLRTAFNAIAQAIQTSTNAAQVQAALTDIVPAADAGHGLMTESHVGELWQARGAATPYVDFAFTRKDLTSGFKMIGWAWQARPTVAPYAGNKTEIPSSTASTRLIEASVERMAGGWDVDRIYVDLADGAMVEELVRMAVEDYADKANAAARADLIAAATTVDTAGLNLSGVLTAVGSSATGIGARIDYLSMSSDVWTSFANLSALDVPWWLRTDQGINIGQSDGAIGNVKLWVDPDLAAGQWVAGDKRAATWWDKRPPVRVQAIDLPRGGIDVGVFGYHASTVSEPRAVFTGTVADE